MLDELMFPEPICSTARTVFRNCRILDRAVYEKLSFFAARGGVLIAVDGVPEFAMEPCGKGPAAINLPVLKLDYEDTDFAGKLAEVLNIRMVMKKTGHDRKVQCWSSLILTRH